MRNAPPLPAEVKTALFGSEIERAFVSALWRHPEFIDRAVSFLDPELYISDPIYRCVLYAISVTWWNSESTDWVLVVQTLRELGEYEACGGHQGLNSIYTNGGLYPFAFSDPQPIIKEYADLLIAYRDNNAPPGKIPVRYSGGKGEIILSGVPHGETGYAFVAGKKYRLTAWREGNRISFKLIPDQRRK